MNKSKLIDTINEAHKSVLIELRDSFDRIISYLENDGVDGVDGVEGETNISTLERILPLTINPVIFRKQKPIALLFGETRVQVKTWSEVHTEVLRHCIKDPVYYNRLMQLRGRIAGNSRVFIAETPDSMRRPRKVCEGLYTEVMYGSETQMSILVERILKAIRYDCRDIYVVLFNGHRGTASRYK